MYYFQPLYRGIFAQAATDKRTLLITTVVVQFTRNHYLLLFIFTSKRLTFYVDY